MSKKSRFWAILLAAVVLFVMVSSVSFIAIEAGHDCTGDDCPVCCQISLCEQTLKSVGQTLSVVILAAYAGIFVILMPSVCTKALSRTSLVSLKVKLTD